MTDSVRELFHANKMRRGESDTIKVLVSLTASPDDSCLAALQGIGLTVTSVVGNKLTGEIESKLLSRLQQHTKVAVVELSARLKPTDDRDGDT